MKISKYFSILISCFTLVFFSACSKQKETPLSSSEALQKFQKACVEEYKYPVIVKPVGKTLWIYLPLREGLMDITSEASSLPADVPPKADEKMSLLYWEAKWEGKDLLIQYDAEKRRSYPQNLGYKTAYSQSFQQKQQNVFSALLNAFYESSERPEFVIFVMTDINSGIEVQNFFTFEDLRMASSMPPALSPDEYAKRYVYDVKGNPEAVNDLAGKHLDWTEMTWPEFIRRQIKHRIRFKYQQSTFPPSDDTAQEIGRIARDTIQTYTFTDFGTVQLENLASGEKFEINLK